jgi:2-C-methyl-D-erythritol 4-phosphate cytidylyltransferase
MQGKYTRDRGEEEVEVCVVVAAGGKGLRLGSAIPKQFLEISGVSILAMSIQKFENCAQVDKIVVSAPTDCADRVRAIAKKHHFKKIAGIAEGGERRQDSVANALGLCAGADIVLVHDAARPFVSQAEILSVIEGARAFGACSLGTRLADTVKRVGSDGSVAQTLDRSSLMLAQTPQGFKRGILERAHIEGAGAAATDDAQLVEWMGLPVKMVEGCWRNIKITTADDLRLAGWLAEEQNT